VKTIDRARQQIPHDRFRRRVAFDTGQVIQEPLNGCSGVLLTHDGIVCRIKCVAKFRCPRLTLIGARNEALVLRIVKNTSRLFRKGIAMNFFRTNRVIASATFATLSAVGMLLVQSSSKPAHAERVDPPSARAASEDKSIRPFRVNISEEQLVDLRRRIAATQWPERETVTDATQGVQLATMQKLARYWASEYDWRKVEAKLNSLPQFVTTIDGLDIHFIHVRSKHPNALPIIVTHGWPGSIVEQLKIIGPLTDPTAYGGRVEDAFDVVIPSIPGYGFSGRPTTTGWDPARIGRAWAVLMKRLGYTRYVAQGGDWGAIITDVFATQAHPELIAIHTNMPGAIPPDIDKALQSGASAPSGLSADEKLAYERLAFVYAKGVGYAYQMGLRPQTLYGIADSPIGLAAYFLDHDARSYELITRVFDGQSEGLTRDDILDNITITWFTNTAVSGARLYWEQLRARGEFAFFSVKGVSIPVAVSVFPDELYPAPRSWAERAYPKLIYYNKHDKGGHFAAWEQPQLLVEDVRAAFKSLR
jgi:pimeloyl-ACP methyl ester carboxylesterase